MHTDFKILDGIIPVKDATFEDLFELIRTEREIIAAGAEAVSYEHERVRMMIRNTIGENWGKFRSGQGGDRGGFRGHFEADIDGIARKVMKPLDASYQNLATAQYNLVRFPQVFARWMEPIKRPGPTRDSFRVDGRGGVLMSYFEEVAQEIESGRLEPFLLFRGKNGEFVIDFGTKPARWPGSPEKSAEYRRVLADALVTERATIKLTGDGYRITEVRA